MSRSSGRTSDFALGRHAAWRWVLWLCRLNGDSAQGAYVALLSGVVLVIALGFGGSGVAMAQTPAQREEVDRLNSEVVQLHQQGQYEEALKRAQAALALAEETFGPAA